jgi:NAD(P)-dependent dehydrogenase (short-subunit alcohol dehydrogenase family)
MNRSSNESIGGTMNRIALVTGATQGLGLALVQGLARQLNPGDVVYLTGRNPERLEQAKSTVAPGPAEVRTELLDVATPDQAAHLAATLKQRHGGVDILINNAIARVYPDQPAADVIDEYVEVNNLGTTRVLDAFGPMLRPGGRLIVVASSLGTLAYLAPVLHRHFDDLASLRDVDQAVLAWRDAVRDGSAFSGAWPAFINIPSKIGQVAAVRSLAVERRDADVASGTLIAAFCPGMINTPTSGAFWDVSTAATPDEAAVPLLNLVLDDIPLDSYYGQLIRGTDILPWKPGPSDNPDR